MPPEFKAGSFRCELSPRAFEQWNPAIRAAIDSTPDALTIYGVIGDDWYGEGITVKRVDAALQAIGDKPVTVYINSPGGDMFEGLAIYNRLREHSQTVTTKVVGLAASAASLIAMAGAERQVAASAFLMIHNCWTWLAANRHGLRSAADDMQEFDTAMAELYAETSGQQVDDIVALMDGETFIRGKRAIELGLATSLLAADEMVEQETDSTAQASALKAMDMALARAGMPRSERRELFARFKSGTPHAAGGDMPNAVPTDTPRAVAPDLSSLLMQAKSLSRSLSQ